MGNGYTGDLCGMVLDLLACSIWKNHSDPRYLPVRTGTDPDPGGWVQRRE